MNIFLITSVPLVPPWDQGAKNLAYALTGALPGHRFRVLTTRGQPAPEGANLLPEPLYRSRHPSLWQKARVYWRLLRLSEFGVRTLDSRAANTQYATRNTHLYHLVYRPYALSSLLCRLLPAFRRRPTLHTVPATADGRSMGRHLFFADRLVALSEHGRRRLARLGLTRTVHIPPGIEVGRWAALRSQADRLKVQLELAGHPVILFPGHYGPGHGAEVLLRALPRIAGRVPEVRVLFACRPRSPEDRERERAARQAVARMGLGGNVRFYNTVADMRPLVGASDLTVLPLETMRGKMDIPTTLLESLAAGKPVVISDLPPMNEVMQRSPSTILRTGRGVGVSEVGLAVPPGDAETLGEAVVALLKDARRRERMGRRGQELIRERFDIRRVARKYDGLYEEMMRK